MIAICPHCGHERDCEPFSGLCVDCLIADAKRGKPEPRVFDHKAAQSGERDE
jgi:NMD protein affecting ribosome stability and mRNA decay